MIESQSPKNIKKSIESDLHLQKRNAPILITSAHNRIGFNVATSLVRSGYPVVTAGRVAPTMCSEMKGVIADLSYPDPFFNPQDFCDHLIEISKKYGCESILPVHEEIFVVASMHSTFTDAGINVISPPLSILTLLHDKANVSILGDAVKVPTPSTMIINDESSLEDVVNSIGETFIVKPRWGSGSHGIQRISTLQQAESLAQSWRQSPPKGRLIAQEIVPGCGAGVGVLLENKNIKAIAGHLRVRELPITGGTSCARITLKEPSLIEATQKLILESGLSTGICMVEFRFNQATGEYWALEFNPRYWGGLSTEIKSGVDFPKLHVESGLNQTSSSIVEVTQNIESRWLMGEIRYFIDSLAVKNFSNIANMFKVAADHKLYIEDFGSGRFRPFFNQLKSAYTSYKSFGNFGFQSPQKDIFFDRIMQHPDVFN